MQKYKSHGQSLNLETESDVFSGHPVFSCVSDALFGTRKIASLDKDAIITHAICVANVWTFTTGFQTQENVFTGLFS